MNFNLENVFPEITKDSRISKNAIDDAISEFGRRSSEVDGVRQTNEGLFLTILKDKLKESLSDPDNFLIDLLWPGMKKVGEIVVIPQDTEPKLATIIRRTISSRAAVLFAYRYADGKICEWEFFN